MSASLGFEARLARLVRLHALGWLLVSGLAGVWLSVLLLWPQVGGAAIVSYGRWMPVHMDGQLYGWCALPLVGVLLAGCLEPRHPAALGHARAALGAWSAALALGAASWLGGGAGGKLFLDWAGWARWLPGVSMTVLWTLLAAHLWWGRARAGTTRWRVAAGLTAALLPVPAMMFWVAGGEVYPSVNPDSGGATGASLLGSTLGIVAIYGLLPLLLGMRPREGARGAGWFWAALAGSFAVFVAQDHGHASHYAAGQIAGLGLLLAWVPLLWLYGARWAWSAAGRRWALAAGGWWAVLVASGWVMFLPGAGEATKFTHVLVAHAHLAMAGLVSAVNFAVLNELDPVSPTGGRAVFLWWNGGTAAHVAAVAALGLAESGNEGALFYGVGWVDVIFGVRLLAGLAMLAGAALAWKEARVA